jgi:hypothetical protein
MQERNMKKIVAIALGTIIAGSAAFAQSNQVLSRNAVGYEKFTVTTNKLYLLRNDFVGLGKSMSISNAIGDQLPANSQVILWDDSNQTYRAAINYTTLSKWGQRGTTELYRGMAFFIRTPASAPSNTYDVYIMGEVPDRFTASNTPMTSVLGLNPDGIPYPVSDKWTNSQYAKSLPNNSQLIIWNEANQTYNAAINKTALSGWGTIGNATVINPGQGFFVRSTNTVSFNEPKPYTWP